MENQQKSKSKYVVNALIGFVSVYVCYKMGQWIVPFVIALIFAYAFHVPMIKLSKGLHISSTFASSIIVLGIISFLIIFSIFLIPLLKNAMLIIAQKSPAIVREIPEYLNTNLHAIFSIIGIQKEFDVGAIFNEYISAFAINLPRHILGFIDTGMTLIYLIMFVFMTPILTFYLLKDWEKIENSFAVLLRKITSNSVIYVLSQVNIKLGAYIRGQLIVCLILSIIYSTGLFFIGVDRYIVCGIISGMLAIAPFLGSILGLITTLATSLNGLHCAYQYVAIIAIYLVIPFVDSNFITPRFIGRSTGIQPVWLIFSICACVSILGTAGIFISVPMAVIISTVCKEIVKKL